MLPLLASNTIRQGIHPIACFHPLVSSLQARAPVQMASVCSCVFFSGVCVVVCACIRLCLNTSAFVGVFTSRCGQGAPYGDSEISTRCLEVSFSEKHESLSAVNEF